MSNEANDGRAPLSHRRGDGFEVGFPVEQSAEGLRLLSDLAEEQFARTVWSSSVGHQSSSRSPLVGSKTCASSARGRNITRSPCFGALRESERATSFVV